MSKITRTATERMVITLTDNSEEVMNALKNAISRGLASIGDTGSRHAKDIITAEGRVDTGRMRNSISFEPKEPKTFVAIGTNVEYAPYIEFGTGKFAESGGRPTPWRYQDDKGNWHTTNGMRPQPYLRPAIDDHMAEYEQIVKDTLQNG